MKTKKSLIKRLNINVTEELLKNLKGRALLRNWTLTKWVMVAITKRIQEEDKYMDL